MLPKMPTKEDARREIEHMGDDGTLTVKLELHRGLPLDARLFAKCITNTCNLLDAVGKNMAKEEGGQHDVAWTLSHLGVVHGVAAEFRLTPVSKKWLKAELKKAQAAMDKKTESEAPDA